jgi:hypothetical protein
MNGYIGGTARAPLAPPNEEALAEIRRFLEAMQTENAKPPGAPSASGIQTQEALTR